ISSRTSSPSFSFLYSSILFMACPLSRACGKNEGRKECATDVSKGLSQDNCMRAEQFSLLPAQAGVRRADRARAARAADRKHFAARAAAGCPNRTAALCHPCCHSERSEESGCSRPFATLRVT